MAKTIAGQGDTFRSTQVDDEAALVYHYMAVSNLVYAYGHLAIDFNACVVTTTMDAC